MRFSQRLKLNSRGGKVDLSSLSTADLQALASGDMSKVSTQGLKFLAGPQPQRSIASRAGGFLVGAGEQALHAGSELAAFPVEGVASAYQLATAPSGTKAKAASQAISDVGEAMTYQPRTPEGKQQSELADLEMSAPGRAADYLGGKVTQATGSAGAGAATSFALQAAPAALGGEGLARVGRPKLAGAAEATARAQSYVSGIGLDWNKLAGAFKTKLTQIAQDSQGLQKLDPEAVKRVARSQSVGAPITRGQATRDLSQITHEENLTRSESGKPLRDISSQQDVALHGQLDTLRQETGGKADTRLQLGESVQGAERGKLQTLQAAKRLAYKKAKNAGELEADVQIAPLEDWLRVPANARNAGYLRSAIDDYRQKRVAMGKVSNTADISINDLEEIRKEANVKVGSNDAVQAHYAREAVKQIDDILNKAGGSIYKQARAAHAAEKAEFDRQSLIKKLTSERARTSDRAVALEDTFDTTVRNGSNAQLQQLKKSLTEGGTAKTRARGAQAWSDLQAATIDFFKEKAAGKRTIPGEKQQLQFSSSFIDAFDELDRDGKLDVLFGDKAKATLRQLREVTRDLRTKPADRIAGPNTTPRLVALLDKLSSIPGVGHIVGGTAKLVHKVSEMGKEASEVKGATRTPVDEAVPAKIGPKVLRRSVAASPFTLQDLDNQ
jgi:hypothetical protein